MVPGINFSGIPCSVNTVRLAPPDLYVAVDGITGNVVTYWTPSDRPIMAPVVPRVSLAQAKRIAARFARYNPAQVPFSQVRLQIMEHATFGIQMLV